MTETPQADPPFHRAGWPFYWIARLAGRYLQTTETALEQIGIDVPSYRVC